MGSSEPVTMKANDLEGMFNLMHRLQILTGYEVAIQFTVNQANMHYVVIAVNRANNDVKSFPVIITPEDREKNTDEELISKTFQDIFDTLQSPQPVGKPDLKIVKG